MRLPESIYLVRHGSYDEDSLTDIGKKEARQAAEILKSEGFNGDAQILASTTPRTKETAEIIGQVLGLRSKITFNTRLARLDDFPECRQDIREVISEVAHDTALKVDYRRRLAVVGHAPMILNAFPETDLNELSCGSVHKLSAEP